MELLFIFLFQYPWYKNNDTLQSTLWMCSTLLCLDIYTTSCNVMSKPKVVKPLHLHAWVNWCIWPVKPALRSTGGERRSLQGLIITAINIIRGWRLRKAKEQTLNAKFNSSPLQGNRGESPEVHLSCFFICLIFFIYNFDKEFKLIKARGILQWHSLIFLFQTENYCREKSSAFQC